MSLEDIVTQYGYLGLFIGTLMEGETVLIVSGLLAHSGLMNMYLVLAVAWMGTFLGDQAAFYIGYAKGRGILERRKSWQPRVDRLKRLLFRHESIVLIGFRFVYGIRILTPILLGSMGYSKLRFFVYNAVGATVWTLIIGYAGYFFGKALEFIFDDIKRIEIAAICLVIAAGITYAIIARVLRRRRAAAAAAAATTTNTTKPTD